MDLTSFSFVLFFLVTLAVYYRLPRRGQNIWLLLVSLVYCATWAWQFALILLLVAGVNFFLAPRLRANGVPHRGWLWVGILFNLGVLLLFRLARFFIPQLLERLADLGWTSEPGALLLLVPIGLSYYVLENIAYLLEVYRGQTEAAADGVDFFLYLAYFPRLVAGPIERASTFLPQLARPRTVDNEMMARGLGLILLGASRKIIVANTLIQAIPWDLFESPTNFNAPELWGWLIVYAFYLYNDFAGYTNLVCGLSCLFGIEISPNFQQPYFARNFAEFWNRWHITLSHWLRDTIYLPLSRALLRRNFNRTHPLSLVLPPLVTMLVSGLWHGLSSNMVVWGLLHGMYQVGERLPSRWGPVVPPQKRPVWRQVAAACTVFILVIIAWVPFRLELPEALTFWRQLFLAWGDFGLRYRRILFLLPYLLIVVVLDWLQYRAQDDLVFRRWPRPVQAVLLAVVLFLLLVMSQGDSGEPFVYQGF
ncbi:MAG: hypothetical protein KJ063_20810 [Anaerolineae bacterium]|nr:hypothetical protein [Anaerolineae bacterium]